jgi:hypothetical protein
VQTGSEPSVRPERNIASETDPVPLPISSEWLQPMYLPRITCVSCGV